jgi:flavin reductase (DIM6/NTAB) family NADH-FMN oxidoreductase RutF
VADLKARPGAGNIDALTSAADYPLIVVTTSVGDELSGCLAGFVTQCSIKPVRFIVCISKVNHTFGVAERASALALHLLGSDQGPTAALFGEESGDCTNKFAQVGWSPGKTGAPILTECAAWVEGPIIGHNSAGDHEAFLMSVSDGGQGNHGGQFLNSDAVGLDAGHPA